MRRLYLTVLVFLLSFSAFGQVGVINGIASVCVGLTTSLSDTTGGGTWSSSNSNATIGSSTGIVTGNVAGTVTITYTATAGTAMVVVTVNPDPTVITGTLAFCVGTTTSLNSTPAGGIWGASTGVATVGSSTGIATGLSAGTAVFTYSLPTGCITTTVVTVNPMPSGITGTLSMCGPSMTVLTDAVAGGTWSSSNVAVASVGSTGFVTGNSPGVTTITYTLTTGCMATVAVTVSPLPPPIVGSLTMCSGGTTSLSDVVSGGIWVSSNPGIATIASTTGVVTGVAAGTAVVSYALASGCDAIAIITVNPMPPAITGTPSACTGGTTNLTDATGGGTWSSSNTAVGTVGPTGVVAGIVTGTTTISYTVSPGCSVTTNVAVTICTCAGTPAAGTAIASDTVVCFGYSTILGLSGTTISSAITYQWQTSPDGITWTALTGATTSSYSYNPSVSQNYRVVSTCSSSGLSAYSAPIYVRVSNGIGAHSIISIPDTACNAAHFYISTCGISASYNVTTYFGDGLSSNVALTTGSGASADVYHTYNSAGSYTVKQVLYNGTIALDSITFAYEYLYCRVLPVKFYDDLNSNCVFDAGETYNTLPVYIEVDSNGVVIDTISATSGFYRKAFGAPGTIYGFRVLPLTGGMVAACLTSGILYDTIQAYVNTYSVQYVALSCASSSGFDLSISASQTCGRHRKVTSMMVTNTHCYTVIPVVTMISSPKYNSIYPDTYPTPTSVSGNVLSWTLPPLAAGTSTMIWVHMERTLPWLTPGDSVMTTISVGPTIGDIDTTNNVIVRCDTVNASYDPNDMEVFPQSYILPCTQLQYKVDFENTGNDTAHNIYVMDTLSDNLDVHSMSIVAASAIMNTSVINDGVHNIVRFDFPNINLLDSSHNLCNGMVIFNIKAKTTLVDGATITNEAGIYFDDNPVVMTNAVQNTIGISQVIGAGSVCVGAFDTLIDASTGGVWSASNTTGALSGGVLTAVTHGIDTIRYTVSNSCASRTATKIITIGTVPVMGAITGSAAVCAGSTTVLADTTVGGAWSSSMAGVATVNSAGVVSGITAGTAIVSYMATNTCGPNFVISVVTVNPVVVPAVSVSVTPGDTVCMGYTAAFTATGINGGASPLYQWRVNGVNVGGSSSTYSYAPANGDVVKAIMTSSNNCATPDTALSNWVPMTVETLLVPSLTISANPGFTVAAGQTDTLTATVINGGSSPTYQWVVNNTIIPGATNAIYYSTFSNNDSVTCRVVSSGVCSGLSTFNAVFIHLNTTGVPVLNIGGQLTLYPNPANNELNIAWENHVVEAADMVITDIAGRVVYRSAININNPSGRVLILIAVLQEGIYLVSIHSNSGQYHSKLEIKR